MPWQGVSPVDLRVQFVTEYLSGLYSMTELAEQYDSSRKTGYKWVARYETAGPGSLVDRSRRPEASPDAVAAEVVDQLVQARRRKPYWGARKLRRWLVTRAPAVSWPSRSTVHAILRRHGAVRQRRLRRRLAPLQPSPLRGAQGPNDVWTVDFKGPFRLASGQRGYPLTLRDLASRYTLRCDAPLPPLGCRHASGATTAIRSRGPASRASPAWRCGGCAWASRSTGSRWGGRIKTGPTSSFIASGKRKPPGRPPLLLGAAAAL